MKGLLVGSSYFINYYDDVKPTIYVHTLL